MEIRQHFIVINKGYYNLLVGACSTVMMGVEKDSGSSVAMLLNARICSLHHNAFRIYIPSHSWHQGDIFYN